MASKKDKLYHILRNPENYGLEYNFKTPLTKTQAENKKTLDSIKAQYGFKEKVEDKCRRGNTRGSSQSAKQMVNQMDRAKNKQGLIKILKEI